MSKLKKTYSKLLASTGKSLGIDAAYFAKGGLWGTVQQIIGLSSGLVIAYMFGHWAPKALFGEYNLVLSIFSTVSIVSIPGLSISLFRSVARGWDSSLKETVKTRFLWSLLGIPLILFVAYYYLKQNSDVLPMTLVIISLAFPFFHSFGSVNSFFVAKKRFDLQALFVSISSLLTATLVGLAVFFTNNLLLILGGYIAGVSLPLILGLIYSEKKLVGTRTKVDKDLVPYGYFLTKLQILPIIASHISNILLAIYLGVDALAVFIVASKFPGIIQKNFDVFFKPITAKLAAQSAREHKITLKKHLGKFFILGLAMFSFIWLFVPWLIPWLYGPQYFDAIGHARFYSWLILPLPLIWLFGDIITFQKRKRVIFYKNTFIPILKLIAYFIIIPRWQITGLIAIMLGERIFTLIISGVSVLLFPAQRS